MCNPGSYTAWHYRRTCLYALNSDLKLELDFLNKIARFNPKNYQIWHHRKEIVEKFGNPSMELGLTQKMFDDDAKNYHAWGYRQWVIKTYDLWDHELTFTELLLEEDPRNNSAWNQRHFVIYNTEDMKTDEIVLREIQFCQKHIKENPTNESPWQYLKGLFSDDCQNNPNHNWKRSALDFLQTLKDLVASVVEGFSLEHSAYSLQFLTFLLELEGKKGLAARVLDTLIEVDFIRERYWKWRKSRLSGENFSFDQYDYQISSQLPSRSIGDFNMYSYFKSRSS